MTKNPVRRKYACARALLRMSVSKRRHISHEIQKSIALAGSLFCGKKASHKYVLCRESIYPFFDSIREVTLTHIGPTLLISSLYN